LLPLLKLAVWALAPVIIHFTGATPGCLAWQAQHPVVIPLHGLAAHWKNAGGGQVQVFGFQLPIKISWLAENWTRPRLYQCPQLFSNPTPRSRANATRTLRPFLSAIRNTSIAIKPMFSS